MNRQRIAAGTAGGWVCCIAAVMCCVVNGSASAQADEPGAKAEQQETVSGRFVTTTVQEVKQWKYTGLLIALPEGAGLVTVLVPSGERGREVMDVAGKLEAGRPVQVTVGKMDGRLWATGLKAVEEQRPKVEEQAAEQVEQAAAGDAATEARTKDKVDEEFAGADSRARAKIKQLEQRVAELEEQVRQLQASKVEVKEKEKEKPAEAKSAGNSEGKVAGLMQKSVNGWTLPAVVVMTDGGPVVFVVPMVENEKGEKTYDPAVRAVVQSLKTGQQVRIAWQAEGKEKMIKTIEAMPEIPAWPDRPRRRGL